MTRAAFAYANARMRARKTRLLGRDALVHLAVSERPAAVVDGWRDLVSEADGG
jgi:vacuolar-type H+-ATPase subunit C/Vma6